MNPSEWISTRRLSDRIGNLPISTDMFAKFLFPGILHGNVYKYDRKEHEHIKNHISEIVGAKVMNMIHKIGMMWTSRMTSKYIMFTEPYLHLEIFEKVLGKISSLPTWYFQEAIGYGFTGAVFEYDEESIIKLFYTELNDAERKWANFQQCNDTKIFPHIKEWGEDFIVMEKLDTSSESEELEIFKNSILTSTDHLFKKEVGYRILNDNFRQMPLKFKLFVEDIMDAMQTCFKIRTIGDLTPSNIGMRTTTGTIVLIDPIDGVLAKEYHCGNYTSLPPVFMSKILSY